MRILLFFLVGTLFLLAACKPAGPEPGRDAQGANGAVTAGHPLAAEAGLEVLQEGGNAMDAAITMATVLAVARPHMNGLGGDTFLLYYEAETGKVHALNGSGLSGSGASLEEMLKAGRKEMPEIGPKSVSVPGAVGGWAAALEKFGTYSWQQALDPAVKLAENGLPVSERLSLDIAAEQEKLRRDAEAARVYLPGGAPPEAGSVLQQKNLAATLKRIQENGPEEFYTGETSRKIVEHLTSLGGFLTAKDLAGYQPEWVEPISTDYHSLTVYVEPPNTQGVALLAILQILSNFDVKAQGHNSADYFHTLTEAIRVASAERDANVADPRFMKISVEEMIDPERLSQLATMIDPKGRAPEPKKGKEDNQPNTVALMVADKDGNVVSLIQSLFHSFGSGIVVPEAGVVLHNRGSLFQLAPRHPNALGPGRRPYHTLCPALVLKDGKPWMAFGTPGGDGQTHTLTQVLHNILFFGMTPQEAIDAPRLRRYPRRLSLEDRVSDRAIQELTERGYRVRVREGWTAEFGGAQAILIYPETGAKRAGADRRREGWALAY
jgi:gamma-glutamyltranspeptidase/glutathione hydrolase